MVPPDGLDAVDKSKRKPQKEALKKMSDMIGI
ncbi:hypothetical protein FHX15_006217 [Rhizobium sp. BK650]|nr:hypothetical protein [Rhizobium sp. BK650]